MSSNVALGFGVFLATALLWPVTLKIMGETMSYRRAFVTGALGGLITYFLARLFL